MRLIPLPVGTRFGSWTVIGQRDRGTDNPRVLCRCDCGHEHRVVIHQLRSGRTTQCATCGRAARRTHGMSRSPEYSTHKGMLERCHNPDAPTYAYYGARGIRVCEEWRGTGGFERFYAHIGPRPTPRHSVDRIDNARGYEPGNVRWATRRMQARNSSGFRRLRLHGRLVSLKDIGDEIGVTRERVRQLLARGMTPEQVVARGRLKPGAGKRHCSQCGEPGHYAPTCPQPLADAAE